MKKIIIAVFIVIATLGIAAGTTAKKAPVKTTSKTTTTTKKAPAAPKKEVTDPYVGWWFAPYDEATAEEGDNNIDDMLLYVSKENGKYYMAQYVDLPKEKGLKFCKNWQGVKWEITEAELKVAKTYNKRATKEQVERLKYNMENGVWQSKKICDSIN